MRFNPTTRLRHSTPLAAYCTIMTNVYAGKATRIIPFFPELVEPLRDAFEQAAEGAVYVVDRHAPPYLRNKDRSKLDKIKANLGSIFAGYVERAGLTVWPKIINNLRASMETDLLNQKYGKLSITAPLKKIEPRDTDYLLGHLSLWY